MGIFSRFKGAKKKGTDNVLLILYGTKSGNAKLIAQQTQKYYQKMGVESLCKNMAGYKPIKLKEINQLLIIVSTHGEGEPPPSAIGFFNECMSDSMPDLNHLNYSICALGDSSYEEFCWAGKEMDKRFTDLGAKAISPRKDCDLDFSNDAIQWIKQSALVFNNEKGKLEVDEITEKTFEVSRQFSAKIKTREELTKDKNVAPVCHLVLDISESDLKYTLGDSVVFKPKNPECLVELVISEFARDGIDESNIAQIKDKLLNEYEITKVSKTTIRDIFEATKSELLNLLLDSDDELSIFVSKANLYDLLKDYNLEISLTKLITLLPKLKGRKYSIASSQRLYPNELHLTIKTIRYDFNKRKHEGAGSVYANEFLKPNTLIRFSVSGNKQFALPSNKNTPIIMIGVSTGIAPFRAILQERQAQNIYGNTWLVWGNKRESDDFLYENDLDEFLELGVLEKINLAFSCDIGHKQYVQDELQANSENFVQWITKGAHVFVCGSISMGKSVKKVVDEILTSSNISANSLVSEGRYHEDIY